MFKETIYQKNIKEFQIYTKLLFQNNLFERHRHDHFQGHVSRATPKFIDFPPPLPPS